MFPELPNDLSAVEDEQLAQLRDELRSQIKHVAANRRDPEVVGDLTQKEVTDKLQAAVGDLETVKDTLKAREDEEARYDAEVERLAQEAGVDVTDEAPEEGDGEEAADGEGDGESDGAEGDGEEAEAEAKPEPIAASAKLRPLPAARRHKPQPTEYETKGLRLTSQGSGLFAQIDAGTLLNRKTLAETMTELVKKSRVKPGQRVIVASASYDYPDERILDQTNGSQNTEKIQEIVGTRALVASGGLCAPLTPIYDLPGVEVASRPVRDGLPSFQASRGGVIVGATPGMGDYAAAVGTVSADDNAEGGTFALKNCHRIECPEFTPVEVDSIYHCIEADNLAARAYPELMARIDELVRAEQARLADGKLLTGMAALSTAVTGGSLEAGAVWAILGDIYKAAAGYRSRNRMAEGSLLQVFIPAWIIDLLALDVARGQFDRFQTRQQVETILRGAGISPVFHLDGSSTATDGQVFGPQSAGALLEFPDTVEWILAAPGTFLHLDSGVLEIGIVRDSSLNATNDFQIFGETWEQVTKVGGESLVVTTTLCPSGEVSAPADVAGLCGT